MTYSYEVPDSPKMLRETLCIAMTRIGQSDLDQHRKEADIARLQRLADACDRNRPLGPDGKHDDRHTSTCGCEDVPAAVALPEPRRRLRACVERWPEAESFGYDPRCCRFPKSCSATSYDENRVKDENLEPPQ